MYNKGLSERSTMYSTFCLPSPSTAVVQHSSCQCRPCDGPDGAPSKWAHPGRAPSPRTRKAGLVAGSRLVDGQAARTTRAGHRRRRYSNRLAIDAPRKAPFHYVGGVCSNYSNQCVHEKL